MADSDDPTTDHNPDADQHPGVSGDRTQAPDDKAGARSREGGPPPLIGITGWFRTAGAVGIKGPHLIDSPIDLHLTEYSDKVHTAGGIPVGLSVGSDPAAVMERLDGLLLSGGADIDPRLWGATPGPRQSPTEPRRDRFESELLAAAVDLGKPVLGICRGIQLINAHFGGTLVPHLPPDVGEGHSAVIYPRQHRSHPVTFEPGSTFARLYGPGLLVNSFHHQAVDEPGEGVRIVGRAPDGVVEAIEHESLPILGVQWHPEMLVELEPVFAWLVGCAPR